MKRRPHFLIAFLAAALTFGSLMAFVGPQNSGWNRDRYGWQGDRHHHRYMDQQNHYERNHPADSNNQY